MITDKPLRLPPARTKGAVQRPIHRPTRLGNVKSKPDQAIEWCVAITTAPRKSPTLQRTVESLRAAGFGGDLLIFSDGDPTAPQFAGATVIHRQSAAGAFPSWWLAAQEMWLRHPLARRYMIVQDDTVFCRGVREYVESQQFDEMGSGLISLYTARGRDATRNGFHAVPPNLGGMGAHCYLFTQVMFRRMLGDPAHFFAHRLSEYGKKRIDTTIHNWCVARGLAEIHHTPSLCQHDAEHSTLGHGKSVGRRRATSFPGEDCDALSLPDRTPQKQVLEARKSPRRKTPQGIQCGTKIGIMGWNTATGLGTLNRSLCDHLPVSKWFVDAHGGFPMLPPHELVDETISCPRKCPKTRDKLKQFLNELGVVIFTERPMHKEIIPWCQENGIKTVCIPMWEWLPAAPLSGWCKEVDLFLCPNQHCYNIVAPHVKRAEVVPWPIDTDHFKFSQRQKAERFLYCDGPGNPNDRRGGLFVAAAARLAPHVPIVVHTQSDKLPWSKRARIDWPAHVEIRGYVDDPADLYQAGDVSLQPSRYEGIGLHLLESMACGMPLITTDSPPMNEYAAWRLVQSQEEKYACGHLITGCAASSVALAKTLDEALGADISAASIAARRHIESEHSWHVQGLEMERIILEIADPDFKRPDARWEYWLWDELPPSGNTAIDVGANRGDWTREFARRFQKVLAIEPQSSHCQQLKKIAPHVLPVPVAAWDVDGEVQIVERIGDMGCAVKGADAHDGLNESLTDTPGISETKVRAITIDSLSLSGVDVIKIDTEGSECHVLRGAADTIERCRPVVIVECHGERSRVFAHEFLRSRGYETKEHRNPDFADKPEWEHFLWVTGRSQ